MTSLIYLVGFLLMAVAVIWFCLQGIVSARQMQQDVRLIRLYLQVGSEMRGASLPNSIWEQLHSLKWNVKHYTDRPEVP
jgi:hypothetical protein